MLNTLRNQKGAVAVLATLAMVALLGLTALVIDVGLLYHNRIQLSNMVDAAALAGARDLPASPYQALASANAIATFNGQEDDTVTALIGAGSTTLKVDATRTVPMLFAKVLGFSESAVTATATAAISTVNSISGVVPLGVEQQQFTYGMTYSLKKGGGDGYTGNYGALALGGTGADVYSYNIENNYNGPALKVGDIVITETGNMVGPTDHGVKRRINKDPYATFETVAKGSPRIIIVPVVDSLDQPGRSSITVVGFAGFFLEGSQSGIVKGRFMKLYMNESSPGPAQDFGLYNIRLIH
jgi:Flp pilus assembly protein TadG